jgi:hypothetical protein
MNNAHVFSDFVNSKLYGYMSIGILILVLIACIFLGIREGIKSSRERKTEKELQEFLKILHDYLEQDYPVDYILDKMSTTP